MAIQTPIRTFSEEFQTHLHKFSTAPYLFVGSGLSRRYLNIPTWLDLLKAIVEHLNLPKPFEFYFSNADGDMPKMATLIGEDLNQVWWEGDQFADSRREFQQYSTNKHSPLKYEITKYIEKLRISFVDGFADEINLLRKANIDGIITTNWDSSLEDIFQDYSVYIGQDELIFSDEISIGQLFKIHGSITDPNSLILNSNDYDDFNSRYPYLAAKLLTIFVEQPIIFLGYSLDDRNIQDILKSIINCLTKEKVEKLKDRLIICNWVPQSIEPTITDSTVLISSAILPIKLININDFTPLFEVLANNKKRLPVKILRQMKDMVYDFVKTSNPKNKIIVSDDLDQLQEGQDVEFVYGIGLKDKLSEHGIKGIDLRGLLRDILSNNDWNPSKIARMLLPIQTARYIPYFKYLRNSDYLNGDGNIPKDSPIIEFKPDFIEKVNAITQQDFYPLGSYIKKEDEINANYQSIDELLESVEFAHACFYIPLLSLEKVNLESLKLFLEKHIDEIKNNTSFRKLICYYDFLKYKLGR